MGRSCGGSFYGIAAPQVKVAEDIATENGNRKARGMAKVVKVNGYSRMTIIGDLFLTVHLETKNYPPFDSQQSMYANFFEELVFGKCSLCWRWFCFWWF